MARVFVMPSRAEGFGFVFLEAMAYGRPVVAGNRDAAREVLGNGQAGLLVDPGDVPSIASALTRVLVNAELREQLGTAARARAQELFGYDLVRRRLESYLIELDSSRRPT
jgi:glycosyltransferase involved in cell wall biosynthesis